jgi:uncharacterized membrane protein YdjX (TVP38/TMEM64 family)
VTAAAGRLRRWLPLAALLALAAAVYLSGLHRELSLAGLARRRDLLQGLVAAHPVLAPAAFVAAYATATALSLPGALFLTLTGGFLFGTWLGGLWSVVGATLGAVALFLIARTAVGASLRDRAGPWLRRLEAGFRRDAFSYLLVLRLVPLVPFWLVNLVPALLGVPLRTFALATLLGIIPGGLVYAGIGDGLGAVLDRGGQPDLGLILEPRVLLPLLGLAALALLPVLYRRLRPPPGGAAV